MEASLRRSALLISAVLYSLEDDHRPPAKPTCCKRPLRGRDLADWILPCDSQADVSGLDDLAQQIEPTGVLERFVHEH